MAVKIVTGCIGAGKTKRCIEEIRREHNANPKKKCIMLVPSYYSHETERMLIEEFGGTGLNNIECTSFEKLSRELVNTAGKRLDACGKRVLICRALKLCLEELYKSSENFNSKILSAVGRKGFVDIAVSFISELNRYNITAEELKEQAERTKNELTKQKLVIMAMVFEKYLSLLSNTEYIDSDEDLSRLAYTISEKWDGSQSIWIDKFDEFLPQQFEVFKALVSIGADITVTFSVCSDNEDTYYGTRNTIRNIWEFTDAKIVNLDGAMEHNSNAPDLHYLFTTWFDRSVYQGKVENTQIFAARDSYTEIEHVACKILDLVREEKYRFKNIGIICANADSYSHVIEAIFDEYEIPYYSDETISISEHPIAMQILSLFNIVENGWDYESVFEYLRAGFVYTKHTGSGGKTRYRRFSSDDLDILENYVLKYGIKYKSAWSRSWIKENSGILDTAFDKEKDEVTESNELSERLREQISAPVLKYDKAVHSAKTVTDYCRALYEFLEDINLYQGLKSELLSMAVNNATADAQRFGQIWNLCLEVLDQVNTALGDEEATHEEFCEYIRSAMEESKIRTVPSGIDRVFIGDCDMNRAINTKVIFVVGAVSGTFPSVSTIEGFLSNAEREELLQNDLKLAPTTTKKAEKQRNTVYKLLSAAEERLYISYPSMDSNGNSYIPSQTVTDIQHKLKDIKVIDGMLSEESVAYVSSPKATMHKRLITSSEHPLWKYVDGWFSENDIWKNRLTAISRMKREFEYRRVNIEEETSRALYDGKMKYSATRLNSYAECPFRHYLMYGLRAKENEEYAMDASDTGTYAHEIIRRFCEKIDHTPELEWKNMDGEQCDRVVGEIVSDTIENIRNSSINDKEAAADILSRMGKTVANAAKAVCKSISCGEFKPEAYEKEISLEIADGIEVGGIIDRLDVCRHDGVNEYRIIDYKTGKKEFEVKDIYYGKDMQPVIYALAIRMLDKDAVISGMYYSMVHNEFASIEATSRESTAVSRLKKNTAFEGMTFVGTDKEKEIPAEEIERIENEYSRNNDAVFFKGSKSGIDYGKNIKTRQESELLMEMVRDKIVQTDREIKNGNIAISPLKSGTRNSCEYCAYASVCKFDEHLKQERVITEKSEDVWNILERDL